MTDVSLFRLYLLRAMYLLIALGLGSMIWPIIVNSAPDKPLMHSVALSLFGALSALCLLGVRYPLQMLPLLFFELLWKMIWIIAVALRLQIAGGLDENFTRTFFECLFGVVLVPIVIPWRYVFVNYLKKPGDRWR